MAVEIVVGVDRAFENALAVVGEGGVVDHLADGQVDVGLVVGGAVAVPGGLEPGGHGRRIDLDSVGADGQPGEDVGATALGIEGRGLARDEVGEGHRDPVETAVTGVDLAVGIEIEQDQLADLPVTGEAEM